jgi:hypothetical protein
MDPSDDDDLADGAAGGDPACWLSLVCPECGAVLESRTGPCWRCGRHPSEGTVS